MERLARPLQKELPGGQQVVSNSGTQKRSGLNVVFFLAAISGFAATVATKPGFGFPAWEYIPTVAVALYAGIVHLSIRTYNDRSVAEHYIDTVYYLGFLFTLFALVTLFAAAGRLGTGFATGDRLVTASMTYIGISVTTSLAGVLLRSMVRGAYLHTHPERTVDTIEAFLAERSATIEALTAREQEYSGALERYIAATESFSTHLGEAQARMAEPLERIAAQAKRHVDSADAFEAVQQRFIQTAESIHREASILPWSAVGKQIESFTVGVRELDAVIDGLVTVLEHKVEKIQ